MPDLQYGYFDANWTNNRKVRKLMRAHPSDWPTYWCAFMALVAECWAHRTRERYFEDALPAALLVDVKAARKALTAAGMLDRSGRLPTASWDEWFGPVQARIDGGKLGAAMRWQKEPNGNPLPTDKPPNGKPSDGSITSTPKRENG
jgi:hypothetical protein